MLLRFDFLCYYSTAVDYVCSNEFVYSLVKIRSVHMCKQIDALTVLIFWSE